MRFESETTANVSLCLFLCAGARGDFLFLDFNGIGRRRADCPRYNFSFSVNMASDAGRLCENSGSDGELSSADFRCLKRLLAALASCCVFVRGPRFCFSVHSVFSVWKAKFPLCTAEKRSDCRPRLTRSNALHFTPCGRAEIPPGNKIAHRAFSRLWRVCAKFAHTQPVEVSKQAMQAERMLPGVREKP